MRPRAGNRSAPRKPLAAGVEAVVRFKLEGRGRRRGRGRAQTTGGKRLNPRVLRALDSMDALAHFAREYQRGTPIPEAIWTHAEIVSEYLGYPPPQRWLWTWLNDAERRRE